MASTEQRLRSAQKVKRAIQLRIEGYTWPQVAADVDARRRFTWLVGA